MENNLSIISWNVTEQCNLRCAHCYLPSRTGKDAGTLPSRELNTEEALRVIDKIADADPEVMLILSGGEPILRKDIFQLAAYASRKGMMVVLGSSGLLIDDDVALHLKESGVCGVSISIDSVDPEIHDAIRLFNGAWKKAVEAVSICRDKGLSVQINMVVTRDNYKEIPPLIKFSAQLGAKVFSPFFLVCTGRGEKLADITPAQYEEVLTVISGYGGKYGGMMIRTRCAPTFRRILYQRDPDSPLLKADAGRCLAGIRYCRIMPEGTVTPCPYMPLSLGNARNGNFRDIWASSEVFTSLRRPLLEGKCGICEFRLLCGGCRARAYAAYGNHLAEDPWCSFTPIEGTALHQPSIEMSSYVDVSDRFVPVWTEEAEARLRSVPLFVRPMVKGAAERYAAENGYREITPEIMEALRKKAGRMGIGH